MFKVRTMNVAFTWVKLFHQVKICSETTFPCYAFMCLVRWFSF
jgi:hypothetical protein